MTWDGVLVAVSSTGRVLAISRELELLDDLSLGGGVSNSIAVDEGGGIHGVTDEAMHRVQWTGARLSSAPQDGAWTAAYETGGGEPAPGRLGLGSGSTPSLMTVGSDELVVITDAQELMHIVLLWRDAIPAGWVAPAGTDPRVAGLQPVTFGDAAAERCPHRHPGRRGAREDRALTFLTALRSPGSEPACASDRAGIVASSEQASAGIVASSEQASATLAGGVSAPMGAGAAIQRA